jgi:hypothetical protein
MKRFVAVAAVLVIALFVPTRAGAGPASAPVGDGGAAAQPDHQHGESTGHLPPVTENTDLVGKAQLVDEPGRISDVSALGGYAYLGSYFEPVCETGGVYVVDIRDPANPKKVGFIKSHTDSYVSEGVQAIHVDTAFFDGDLLLYNNESCDKNGIGGVSIVDVTNPLKPKKLVEGFGDFTVRGKSQRFANQIHSVLAWDTGANAYAVLVDDEEAGTKDVDILDITNPSRPRLIAETGLADWPQANKPGNALGDRNFFHDVEVRKFGNDWIMSASYWDIGYVKLNVTDPAKPVFVDDSDFTHPDPEFPQWEVPEGNGHQSNWNRSGQYLVATDEDFAPYRTFPLEITSGPNSGTTYETVAVGGSAPVTILPDKKLNGPTVYGGYGCPGTSDPVPLRSDYDLNLASGEEAILVLQRGPTNDPNNPEEACFPGEKAHEAVEAGWDAVLLVARHLGEPEPLPPFCGSGAFVDEVVAPCTTHEAFHLMFNTTPDYTVPYPLEGTPEYTEPALGAEGERVLVDAAFDGWGYVHLFDAATLNELDTYAVDETKEEQNSFGKGDLSVHEVDPDPFRDDVMYISYYAAGFRAVQIVNGELVEVAAFIDQGGNNFWGVHPMADTRAGHSGDALVLLSDRDYGLYIVQYTG